jgi:hypothetical protein
MNRILTTAVIATAAAVLATSAFAKSANYCDRVARQAVDEATHPAGSALLGCGAGALLGQVLTKGNGAAVIGGCAAGGVAGVAISNDKQRRIYDEAYNNCMYGSSGYAPPPPPPPPPGAYQAPWTNRATTMGNPTGNVRAGQGTAYPVVYSLPYGTNVNITWCSNSGWCKLQDGNWISQSILRFY